jgi:predicted GNAT superfamily acetyltransferase
MAAVLPGYRDLGIGRQLKLAQRDDALARGILLIEWTFDPLQTRNAYFNICRLGVVVRRYLLNVYGSTSSPLHGGLPTDRLVAEWHLASQRVQSVLAGKNPERGNAIERVEVLLDESSPARIADVQKRVRQSFQELFANGYAVTWLERAPGGGIYILERGEHSE